jgi:hypothetical protein
MDAAIAQLVLSLIGGPYADRGWRVPVCRVEVATVEMKQETVVKE